MEREDGHLDGESQRKSQKEQALRRCPGGMLGQRHPVKAQPVGLLEFERSHSQDRDQHGEAAENGVDHELEGGIHPASLAPDSNQEVERNEHRLPEHVKEDQVEREQDSGSGCLEDE